MPTQTDTLSAMSDVMQQIAELLEDFAAVGEEVWEQARFQAESFVAGKVAGGEFADFGSLEHHRDAMTRFLVVKQTSDFLRSEGFDEDDVERVMLANGQGLSEVELLNLDDGIAPEREQVEAYRIRALCAHYAMICDVQRAQAGLIQGA